MESVEAYLAEIMAGIRPLAAHELSLADAYGAVLAEEGQGAVAVAGFRQLGHGRLRGAGRRPRRGERR